jgi:tetratricopeptide (TPR) repeat protein
MSYYPDDLPVGKYWCEVFYILPGSPVQTVRSKPTLITIAEMTSKSVDMQRDLRITTLKFLAAKAYLAEENREIANLMFASIADSERARNDYGRISNYYQALTEKDPEKKIAALQRYLANPSSSLPHLSDINGIHRRLGRLYFETGNFKAAKESFLKIPEPDSNVQDYLKKIEKASKTSP